MTLLWLTAKFLEEVVQPNYAGGTISVENVETEPAVSKGNNFLGSLYRVKFEVVTDNKRINESFVIKTLPEDGLLKDRIESYGFHVTEVRMYKNVLPSMYKIAAGKLPNYQITPNYFESPKESVLVLEDLKSQGYCMKERHLQLDMEHSIAAISALAKLHAMSIVANIHHPEIKEDFPDFYCETYMLPEAVHFIRSSFKSLVKKFETWKGQEHFLPKIQKLSETVVDRIKEAAAPGPIMALTHGDYWVNNILFRYSGYEIVDVRMIDFQFTRWSSPASDLYYLIFSSLQAEVRENHAGELLAAYHTTIKETLTALGCPEKIFSLEQLHQEMQNRMFFGLLYACLTMCVTLSEPDEVMIVDKEELGDVDVNPIGCTKFSPKFQEVFPKVLKYFEEKGVL